MSHHRHHARRLGPSVRAKTKSRRPLFARPNDQRKDGQADVDKQWADYVGKVNERISKAKPFYHPLGVAFHPLATTKVGLDYAKDKWDVFAKAVRDYNYKFAAGAPVDANAFRLTTTSVTQVMPASVVDQSAPSGSPAPSEVPMDPAMLAPPASEGMGTGTMIAIGLGGLLLVGGAAYLFMRGGGEEEEE